MYAPEPLVTKVLAVVVGAYGVYKLWDVIKIRERITNLIYIPFQNFLESLGNKSISLAYQNQGLNFINGTPSNFRVNSTGRKIIKSDEEHPDPRIANTVKVINDVDEKRNELKSKIDQLLNIVGSSFGIESNKIQETSGLPESVSEETITVSLENFSIEDYPEDIEVKVIVLNANSLEIKFTSEINESKDFTANFIYDDGDFRTETLLNIKLEKDEIDTDEDGVTDDLDLCPDTPAGETIDLEGCSDSQKDSDGDGVNDSADQCPDTPAGETVDTLGCQDNWDPNDESTWAVSRNKVLAGVGGMTISDIRSFTFSLNADGRAFGNNGLEGSWTFDGRTFTINLSNSYQIESTDENGEPVTLSCTDTLSFSGTLNGTKEFLGPGSVTCGCCGSNNVISGDSRVPIS